MNCTDIIESLEGFVDGDLAAEEAAAVRTHLEHCEECAAEHELTLRIRRALGGLPQLDTPPAVLDDVLRKARAAPRTGAATRPRKRASPGSFRRRPAWVPLAAAAAVTLAAWGLFRFVPGAARSTAPGPAGPDAAAVAQATDEARYALAYLGQVSRRAGLRLRDDLLVERLVRPSAESLTSVLSPRRAAATRAAGRPERPKVDPRRI